jgi:hypothetical protein
MRGKRGYARKEGDARYEIITYLSRYLKGPNAGIMGTNDVLQKRLHDIHAPLTGSGST